MSETKKLLQTNLGRCQIPGCTRLAQYGLYRVNSDGTKEWLHVCNSHQTIIGDDNERRLKGGDVHDLTELLVKIQSKTKMKGD